MGSAMMSGGRSVGGDKKPAIYLTASKTERVAKGNSPLVTTYTASFEYDPEFVLAIFTGGPSGFGAVSPYTTGGGILLAQGQSAVILSRDGNTDDYVTGTILFSGSDITLTITSKSTTSGWLSMPHHVNLFIYGAL